MSTVLTQVFDAGLPWQLHPAVSVRPEPFGALLYHFGNRRLSFVKDPQLLKVILALPDQPNATAAIDSVELDPAMIPRIHSALASLAKSDILTVRS